MKSHGCWLLLHPSRACRSCNIWDSVEQVVLAHLMRLMEAGVRPVDVGVITPYNGQVALLRELRPASLAAVEIDSVDGFQGA